MINSRLCLRWTVIALILWHYIFSLGICVAGEQGSALQYAFRLEGSGRTGRAGALYVSFSRFKSQDGVLVERFVEAYSSRAKARTRLKRLTERASAVVGRGPIDPSDRRSDRIVVVLKHRKGNTSNIIAWTDGNAFHYVSSDSSPHVLAFERQAYSQTRQHGASD